MKILSPSGDRLLRAFCSMIAIAVLIGAAYVATTFVSVASRGATASKLKAVYLEGRSGVVHASDILKNLQQKSRESVRIYDRNNDLPLWIALRPKRGANIFAHPQVVEFRNFRGSNIQFWISPLQASSAMPGAVDISRLVQITPSGIVLNIPSQPVAYQILGSIETTIPAKPKVFLWPKDDYKSQLTRSTQLGGALFGVFVGLALFSVLIAMLNRSMTYLLFSGWLITSLRIAAVNGGWSINWLGVELSGSVTNAVMTSTLAAHGVLTVALFFALFGSQLKSPGLNLALRLLTWGGVLLLPMALFLSFGPFMLLFYGISVAAFICFGFCLAHILRTQFSATAIWYSVSFAVMIFGQASEMLYQSNVLQGLAAVFNAQVAAIVSAVLMGIALAEQMRSERDARIQARRREVVALEKIEENYDATPIGLFTVNQSLIISSANKAFRSMFARRVIQVDGQSKIDTLLGADAVHCIQLAMKAKRFEEQEIRSTHNDVQEWYLLRVSHKGDRFDCSIQEITLRKAAEAKLNHLVSHDALTGFLNRRGYDAALQRALTLASSSRPLVMAEIVVDRIVDMRTLHGSQAADGIFMAASAALQAHCPDAVYARIGDVFRVLVERRDAGKVHEQINAFRNALASNADKLTRLCTTSVGLIEINNPMETARAQTYVAQACSQARKAGNNRVVQLTTEDRDLTDHFESIRVASTLEQDLANNRFFLVFQPIVDLKERNAPLRFEALLRMRAANGETVSPARFIPAAEQASLMVPIDRWVVSQTLEILQDNPELCRAAGSFAINLSGASLNDSQFQDDLYKTLRERRQLAHKLCFEVTESVALNSPALTRQFLDKIREIGVKIALDDFGQGYTSWNYLQTLSSDYLKIDGKIVRDLKGNRTNTVILKSIVGLTHELNMSCVAEWIEDEETMDLCAQMGVDFGQGFGLCMPLELPELLSAMPDLTSLLEMHPQRIAPPATDNLSASLDL